MLAEAFGAEKTVKDILPTMIKMSDDSVPNVRFNVAKSLHKVGPVIDIK